MNKTRLRSYDKYGVVVRAHASLPRIALGPQSGTKTKGAQSEQSATSEEGAQQTNRRLLSDDENESGEDKSVPPHGFSASQGQTGRPSELSSDEYPSFVGLAVLQQ